MEMLFQYSNVLLGQELLDAQDVMSRCIAVVKQLQFILLQKHVKKYSMAAAS